MIRIGKIGEGTYGTTYEVKDSSNSNSNKNHLVVKRNIIDATVSFSGSIRELDLLNKLRGHPFVVRILSVSFGNPFIAPNSPIPERRGEEYKEDYLHFVFEKAELNLHNVIHERIIHPSYLKLSMVQILLGIEYMHAKGIMHRDLKPANLLWFVEDGKSLVKLCDFGLSKVNTKQAKNSPHVVTCWYRAPEICAAHSNYSFASDMWSFGCILYEMVSKNPLLIGCKDDDTKVLSKILSLMPYLIEEDVKKITKNHTVQLSTDAKNKKRKSWASQINFKADQINEFNKYPGEGATYDIFLDLLDKLMQIDPDKRLTAKQALDHPFFKPYGEIIEWCRNLFPPTLKSEPEIEIHDCIERRWATKLAFIIFNEQNNLKWYKPRILFQSIDLFDRYLCYCRDNGIIPDKNVDAENNSEKKESGKYLTRYDTHLRYMVCLYMAIKYFNTLTAPISFEDLATSDYKNKKAMKDAEEFEQHLLKDILKFKVYRETVFEAVDRISLNELNELNGLKDNKMDDLQIRNLLLAYGTSISKEKVNPSLLSKEYLNIT